MAESLSIPCSNSNYFDKSPLHTPTKVLQSLDLLSINGLFLPKADDISPGYKNTSCATTPIFNKVSKESVRRKSLVSDLCFDHTISDEFSHIQLSIRERRMSNEVFNSINFKSNKNHFGFNKNFNSTKIIHHNDEDEEEIEIIDLDDDEHPNSEKVFQNCYPNCDVNVWLRSCEHEIVEPIEGILSGQIPDWINGSLLRNGPGSIKVGSMMYNHLFDSSALLHRFNIENGTATYQCRFLKSDAYRKNQAANRIVVTEFGTACVPDPCQSIFQR